MVTSTRLLYWDSCVLISWRSWNGSRTPTELDGLAFVGLEIQEGRAQFITSVISLAEVLASRGDQVANEKLQAFLQRPNALLASLTPPIAKIASEIRDSWIGADADEATKDLADSIHVATAIVYQAAELLTFDGPMLRRDGHPSVRGMRIRRPERPDGMLPLGLPSPDPQPMLPLAPGDVRIAAAESQAYEPETARRPPPAV